MDYSNVILIQTVPRERIDYGGVIQSALLCEL